MTIDLDLTPSATDAAAASSPDAATAAPRERRHAVAGLYNLRDTGGYRAAGGTSRWGKLLRSDALHRIDATGRDRLAEIGVAHIIDLRGGDERATAPSAVDGLEVTVHHLPVFDDADPAAQATTHVGLVPVYDHIVDERGAQLVDAIRVIIAADDDDAVLVHCTAGKDRTGLVVAFALAAAGVDRDDVVADYAATAENLRGEWSDAMTAVFEQRGIELTAGMVELITESPAEVLEALLERIDREHGSISAYLLAHGLTPTELERLTAVIIDPAATAV
ncbi:MULTISPECIES: tyrosine-protein phosphatase [Micrococcales]|jgi:protein-tyrosine phosphatase|uniref:protein-tyrosine-phosphatase n=9 Tax=Micrococcales TaxID=85006 RepID=A0A7W7FHQ9_9MICO|nr:MULTISPECIES: tyrosine-protein phosphatase [Micrococcales]EIC06984.1 protein-tyrosine-phosphatase [Microbacterium laevaniformans OR221]MAK74743.1 protein-tyrosine-phosphatase [Pseudomonadales bacterium]MCV7572823.1 tyrosine-protein phosphatase [Micrococcus luteus]PZO68010.1 MAG: protein-tyrosine-phosphatase [Kocuria palustris]AMG82315.1 protein tyrosine phosphatase [Microbacterium sp. PAMC 28756]|tara:strand:+ start:250672 stop:251502 length:831 start_codon:yes stop_codon:yes gene_type:complete